MSPRATAAQILAAVIENKRSLNAASTAILTRATQTSEVSLVKELCFGVLRWYFRLDQLLKPYLAKPLKPADTDIHALLLIGLYQLLFLRVSTHAAVTETVEAARMLKKPWATKLINGVLRNFLRNEKDLQVKFDAPVAIYSHPEWFIKTLQKAWPEQWEKILTANNLHPPLSIRVNKQKISRDDYLQILKDHHINASPIAGVETAIHIDAPQDPTKLPGFAEGEISVQDSAAQRAAFLLELAPAQRVLDACAAPGGKTAHIAETEPNVAEIVALDDDGERLKLGAQTWQRLHLTTKVKWVVADATQTSTWWDGKLFDRILLDAPCSGTGVIRRHPDIKLLRRGSDIDQKKADAFPNQQLALLEALWPTLKPGGLLLYATCSVLPQENTRVILEFMKLHTDAKVREISEDFGTKTEVGLQLFPEENGGDGFYYAKLEKGRSF